MKQSKTTGKKSKGQAKDKSNNWKNKINPNSTKKLTEFVFTIATFGKGFSKEDVKKALESVRCDDLVLVKREPDLKTKIRGRNSP